ncbi:hypothetical protein [Streptacidiphilus sp. P02-A3a]|uniref:hypothetical protein n=1 Tax=Streptacidiphilus sp. P02-A3a TaxID=2704468 RepID=UPI0015FDD2CD|nr:hypothetical protein [Streptacidiphilus sp. P02-A3a]QMU70261.1 hypothetical protein GXP74_20610 [Streptacidiphilus sp. P02-A3a]QMU70281.1 hypothetical protein GXP74_20760 [Streptacidiphilus sp. P02-A3a]
MKTPEVGQEVLVPWGLDYLLGTVLRVYSTGRGPKVVVQVDVPGVSGDEVEDVTVTLPADAVQSKDQEAAHAAPGEWVHARSYERELMAQLLRMADRLERGLGTPVSVHEAAGYGGLDLVIRSGQDRMIGCEAKYESGRRQISLEVINKLIEQADRRIVPIVLITNVRLSARAAEVLQQVDTNRMFHWILWRGERDNEALEQMVLSLLA